MLSIFANKIHLLKYQTFRALCAVFFAFFISWMFGNKFIELLKKYQKTGQPIRDDGPQHHITQKSGTPTMGGILLFLSVTVSTLLFSKWNTPSVWIVMFAMWGYGLIGFLDDLKKIKSNDNYQGLSVKQKFILQILVGIAASYAIALTVDSAIYFPIFKNIILTLPLWLYLIWGTIVIVGSANAVNLTDGLDGLAIFPVMMASLSLAVIAYIVGHATFSRYLFLPHIPSMGEITVFLGAWVGGSLGFLWFNAPPARVFMGDIGSLAAGSALACTALLIKHELVWTIIGAIFVVEAVSVILQVFYYKKTKKRIFLMAPLHHHFEHLGIEESTIVIRFWIVSVLLALIGLSFLKIR